jgi:tRNA-binding EMAP/Myf-like protein
MTYQGVVTKIKMQPHPNADKLALAEVAGYQVVCGKDTYTDGEKVIFFAEGGQLAPEVCYENNLYRKGKGVNKDPGVYGYFDENRRVHTMKLRGEISEGFMLSMKCFAFTEGDLDAIETGSLLDNINGILICQKYETKATREARQKQDSQAKERTPRVQVPEFAEIGSTVQFRNIVHRIPVGAFLHVTEKIHGTSGRTGKVKTRRIENIPENALQRAWRWFRNKRPASKEICSYEYVTGSRRQIVAIGPQELTVRPDGTKIPLNYRQQIHNSLIGKIHEGEILYYEIVHCDQKGNSDFRHGVGNKPSDPVLKGIYKQYGPRMNYTYGVEPGQYGIWIYKITFQNEYGHTVVLSNNQMIARAAQLGIPVAPEPVQFIYDGDAMKLNKTLSELSEGPSALDSTHIREGIVVRVDSSTYNTVAKLKGFEFCLLEGITKNDDNYVDLEEIS